MAKKGRKGKPERPKRAQTPASGSGSAGTAVATGDALESTEPLGVEVDAQAQTALPPAQRGWSNALIAGFLLLQLALPLRYYLSGGGYDERFSWRMFSTLRMQSCQVKVEETIGDVTGAVDLQKTLHIAWIGMLERYRRPVVDELLARRCAQPDARDARYERSCVDTDGRKLPATVVRMDCKRGTIAVEGERDARAEKADGAKP